MANFTCDICGGTIKMQANKTGICQNCGMEYDIDAIRAMLGAQKHTEDPKPSASPAEIANIKTEQELNRDALLNYLDNLRNLETIIYKSKSSINSLNNMINNIEPINNTANEPTPLKLEVGDYVGHIVYIISFFALFSFNFQIYKEEGVALFFVFLFLICTIICIGRLVYAVYSDNERKKEREKQIEKYYQDLEYNKKEKERVEIENSKLKNTYNQQIVEISTEVEDLKQLLEKAYSANIIPSQFRTIEGVYYLYDYLSTSNQTLSEALMQANLEAIKQKLDNVIKLQAETLIQQAQANAKLDKVVDYSEATMNNTALAAKYAAIAALNSEVTMKLQAKQLAYQKAEFWLK